MPNFRTTALTAALSLALATPAAHAGSGTFELQARTNLIVNDNGFNLPPGASFNSISPDINDAAQVTFVVSVVPGRVGDSVWFGSHGVGELRCDGQDEEDARVSDPRVNAAGTIAWGQNGGTLNGIYRCDPATGTETRITAGPIGASVYESTDINDFGQFGYRATFGGDYAWVSLATPSNFAFHATVAALDVNSPYDYLFSPAFNNARQMAGVVSYAGTSFGHREVRRFDADGTSVSIADNAAGTPGSPYASFNNSVGLNNQGQVAFIARLVAPSDVYALFVSDGTTTIEIARNGQDGIDEIDSFAPAINDAGLVAFRVREGAGAANDNAIFVGDGSAPPVRIVGRGDTLPSDNGPATVGQHDNSVVLGGAPAINASGDIVFTAALHPVGNNQVEWGTGVYVRYAEGAPPLPDPLFTDGFEDIVAR